jgi:GNAT superfamily N-acetyltransferase
MSDVETYESTSDYGVTAGFMQHGQSIAVCNVTRMPQYWWVARVFVRKPYRRQQLGSRCLERAIELIAGQDGPDRIVVAPGGYSTPYDQQCAFYAAHGFAGSGLMERPV